MTLKEFIKNFDYAKPDWTDLPDGWPECDLSKLTSAEVGQFQDIKTLWELSRPVKPQQRSRVWMDPKGYEYLGVWQNAAILRVLIRIFTKGMIKGVGKGEFRLKAQLDDAARSVKRNIEEGWKRPTTSEYLDFLGYSQASLAEVKGDIRDAMTDGFLRSDPGSSLLDIRVDLRVAKGVDKGKIKGEPTEQRYPYSQPLKTLSQNPSRLTYEMLLELINKTDYLLRKLVESLERKMFAERKGYRIEQSRIKDKFMKK